MRPSAARRAGRVTSSRSAASRASSAGALELGLARRQRRLDLALERVDAWPGLARAARAAARPALHQLGDAALLAERRHPHARPARAGRRLRRAAPRISLRRSPRSTSIRSLLSTRRDNKKGAGSRPLLRPVRSAGARSGAAPIKPGERPRPARRSPRTPPGRGRRCRPGPCGRPRCRRASGPCMNRPVGQAVLAHRGVDALDPQARGTRACAPAGRDRRTADAPSPPPGCAARIVVLRRPRWPLACSRTFLCRAWVVTPRLTRAISVDPQSSAPAGQAVGQHQFHERGVARGQIARLALARLGRLRLAGHHVPMVGGGALDLARPGQRETLGGAPLGLHLRHVRGNSKTTPRAPRRDDSPRLIAKVA